jgi:thioredoxin reductase (NADPH)
MQRDVAIIGGGPAGLAAANTLQGSGLSVVVFEKGALAEGVARFPFTMKFFSTAPNLELSGYPLIITEEKPSREEYLNYLRRFVSEKRIEVLTRHEVTQVAPDAGGFVVRGADQWGESFEARARYVVLATGAYDHPQLLGVPGEDLPHVSHYFTEVHPYAFKKVAVVGGRSSAAEVALLLYRANAQVTLIHRGPELRGLKYWVQPDIQNRIRNGEIRAMFNSRVTEIRRHNILVQEASGEVTTLENNFVLAMTGYQPDLSLMRSLGIEFDERTKRPAHDPATLESNVRGLFVAGVITAGNVSGEVFIENSRHHGELILKAISRDRAKPQR